MSTAQTDAIAPLIDEGLAHYRAGKLREAEASYKKVLAIEPRHADALHLLGTVAFAAGNVQAAIELMGRAIAVKPHAAEYWSNLAGALHAQSRFDKAVTAARQALTLRPNYVEAMHHLGRSLTALQETDEAVEVLHHATELAPQISDLHNSFGNSLLQANRLDDAITAYESALAINPDSADVLTNLGLAEQMRGRLDRSVELLQRAIDLNSDRLEALNNLSVSLQQAGRLDEALVAAQTVSRRAPKDAAAYMNIGNVHQSRGEPDEAVAAYLKALEIQHGFTKAWLNLGNTLLSQGRLDEAIDAYEQVRRAKPEDAVAHANQVIARLVQPHLSATRILEFQKEWATAHTANAAPVRRPPLDRSPDRRLRVGYVSPDLRQHVVGFNMLPLFLHHDREQFQIFAYSGAMPGDDRTQQFRSLSDQWRETAAWSDQQLAEKISDDRIDVLVDLTLHLAGCRLGVFARKPAPVQMTFAGYPGGTGVDAIQYRLTDPYLDPPGSADDAYVEKSLRLPHSFWCYDPPADDPEVAPAPALTNGFITFGCLNNFSKISAETIDLWTPVLLALPSSRLRILSAKGSHRERMSKQFATRGVPADRIEFVAGGTRRFYLSLYNRIDIVLDTLPYNGHTTSLDGLWMGVPTITRIGDTVVGRAGWSQLSNLQRTEWAALTDEQFTRVAVDLASDVDRLATIRLGLRAEMQQSPLMHAPHWAAGIEAAYRQAWRAFLANRAD